MNMSRAYRLRYANQLVGAFLLLVLLLIVLGAVLIGQRKDWLTDTFPVYVRLPEKDLDGIREGTEVMLLGQRAGHVSAITHVEASPTLLLTLEIRDTFRAQIYEDSEIRVKRKVAGVGDAYLEISRSLAFDPDTSNFYEPSTMQLAAAIEPPIEDQFRRITEMFEQVRNDFAAVRDAAVPAFDQIGETAAQVERSNHELRGIIEDLKEVSPRLDGLVDQSESVLSGGQQIVDDVRAETRQLPGTVAQLRVTLRDTQRVVDSVRAETDQLPGTVENFNETVDGANDIVEGLRQHWLLRRYIDNPRCSPMLEPVKVGRGGW